MTLSSFSVTAPSQNDYKLAPISLETSKITIQKRQTFWNLFFLENSFFNSRPHMAPQADPQSGKWSYIDPLSFILSSTTGLLRSNNGCIPHVFDFNPSCSWKKHFLIWSHLGFISWRTYSLLLRVRHNSKIGSQNDLLNTKCPRKVIFTRNN